MQEHIYPIYDELISRDEREKALNQRSLVLWMTGLSGSGKSTIAIQLERKLFKEGFFSQVIDGDNIRSGLNNNLGFSLEDRLENIRRIAEVGKLYCQSGIITICSFVSPTKMIRDLAKTIIGEQDFLEVFVDTPLEVCENRDVKGLYAKARKGEIKGFTGIDSPFEEPENPNILIQTTKNSVQESTDIVYNHIRNRIAL